MYNRRSLMLGVGAAFAAWAKIAVQAPDSAGFSAAGVADLNAKMHALVDGQKLAGVVTLLARHAKMATPQAQAIYKRRAICELVHAKLRNRSLDRLYVRGKTKVETSMRWFALANNTLIGHRLGAA